VLFDLDVILFIQLHLWNSKRVDRLDEAEDRPIAHCSNSLNVAFHACFRMSGRFDKILKAFPAIDHAFAYGSGVFGQPGLYSGAKAAAAPMLDLVFGVQDPISWHRTVRDWPDCTIVLVTIDTTNESIVASQNMEMNPSHYSALMSLLGPQAVRC